MYVEPYNCSQSLRTVATFLTHVLQASRWCDEHTDCASLSSKAACQGTANGSAERSVLCNGKLDVCTQPAGACNSDGTCAVSGKHGLQPCLDGHRDGWNASANGGSGGCTPIEFPNCASVVAFTNFYRSFAPKYLVDG